MSVSFGSLVKATVVGAGVCGVAIIAPIGVPVIVALTAAAAGGSLAADHIGNKVKEAFKGDDKSEKS